MNNIVIGSLLVALICGTAAFPTAEKDELSPYFDHVEPEARLVGGTPAAPNSYPFIVAFTTGSLSRTFQCAGSLLTPVRILTAAHCVDAWITNSGTLASSLRGTLGTNRWNSGGVMYSFEANITHPDYLPSLLQNDIALMVPSERVTLVSGQISTIRYFDGYMDAYEPLRVAGWGRHRKNGVISPTLLEIHTESINAERCVHEAREAQLASGISDPLPVDPDTQMCTFHSAGVGICHGDDGGPLMYEDLQVGLVSWGVSCAVGGPDVYVRFSVYGDWVFDNTLF